MNEARNSRLHRTNVRSQHSASLTIVPSTSRDEVMRRLLIDLRNQELRKIRTLVRDETVLANEVPGDELDRARRNGDLEFHASLRDLSESRLTAITSTFRSGWMKDSSASAKNAMSRFRCRACNLCRLPVIALIARRRSKRLRAAHALESLRRRLQRISLSLISPNPSASIK